METGCRGILKMKNYWILKLNKLLFILIVFPFALNPAFSLSASQRHPYPKGVFNAPMKLPPSFSGSFGEIRGNHFHSGLDYRTNQREGYPVYAVADGYVSRLRVQLGGFGNALYVTHPNGFTSVYAHLQRFSPKISQLVSFYQRKMESFAVDFPASSLEIPVKKGDLIAWSGNSGSSGGPHLHYEIRDTKTEEVINPALFGLPVNDPIEPSITALYMYRLNGQPFNEDTPKQYFEVKGSDGIYHLSGSPVINFSGDVGFGITTFDRQAAGNKNGIYSIELMLDSQVVFFFENDRFSFANTRASNAHIDYPSYLLYGKTIQKAFVEPGNPLNNYKTLVNSGIINLKDDSIHKLKFSVEDIAGNRSILRFEIKYNSKANLSNRKQSSGVKTFKYNEQNIFNTDDIKVVIPKGALYNDMVFTYSKRVFTTGYSDYHQIHNRLTPLHTPYSVSIRAKPALTSQLQNKSLIVNSRGSSQGGTYENGFVRASVSSFDTFHITTDTVAPYVKPINLFNGKTLKGLQKLQLKVWDNLSGIASFKGYIDGQWVLMEYDPKSRTMWHVLDKGLSSGKHVFELKIVDNKQNTKNYKATFIK